MDKQTLKRLEFLTANINQLTQGLLEHQHDPEKEQYYCQTLLRSLDEYKDVVTRRYGQLQVTDSPLQSTLQG